MVVFFTQSGPCSRHSSSRLHSPPPPSARMKRGLSSKSDPLPVAVKKQCGRSGGGTTWQSTLDRVTTCLRDFAVANGGVVQPAVATLQSRLEAGVQLYLTKWTHHRGGHAKEKKVFGQLHFIWVTRVRAEYAGSEEVISQMSAFFEKTMAGFRFASVDDLNSWCLKHAVETVFVSTGIREVIVGGIEHIREELSTHLHEGILEMVLDFFGAPTQQTTLDSVNDCLKTIALIFDFLFNERFQIGRLHDAKGANPHFVHTLCFLKHVCTNSGWVLQGEAPGSLASLKTMLAWPREQDIDKFLEIHYCSDQVQQLKERIGMVRRTALGAPEKKKSSQLRLQSCNDALYNF